MHTVTRYYGLGANDRWSSDMPTHWLSAENLKLDLVTERQRVIVTEDIEPLFQSALHRRTDARVAWVYCWLSPVIHALGENGWPSRHSDRAYSCALEFLKTQWNTRYFQPFISYDQAIRQIVDDDKLNVRLSSSAPLHISLGYLVSIEPKTGSFCRFKVSCSMQDEILRFVDSKLGYIEHPSSWNRPKTIAQLVVWMSGHVYNRTRIISEPKQYDE